jgi:hypothetical protein
VSTKITLTFTDDNNMLCAQTLLITALENGCKNDALTSEKMSPLSDFQEKLLT